MVNRVIGLRQNQDGVATLETAIVFPVFLLLLFGTISFGQIVLTYLVSTDALRNAARSEAATNSGCSSDGSSAQVPNANATFAAQLSRFGLVQPTGGLNATYQSHNQVRGIDFDADVPISCVLCGIVPTTPAVHVSIYVPLENPAC